MAQKPTRSNALQPTVAPASNQLHWTDQELKLPMWLRRNSFSRYVVEPVEQVFLTGTLPALFANLYAIVQLARGAEVNILRVRSDHETNPGSMDPPVFVQNVLFCLRTARDEVLSQVPAVHVSVASTRLDRLIDATRATLDAFMSEPVNKILCNKPDCNKGGKHLFPGPWVDATKRSGDAIEDVFRLSNLVGNSTPARLPDLAERLDAIAKAVESIDARDNGPAARLPKTRRGFQKLATSAAKDLPVIADLKSGLSYRDTAKRNGVSKTTVGRIAEANDLTGHAPDAVPLGGTLDEKLTIRRMTRKRGAR